MKITIMFDGACSMKKGHAAGGAVALDADGNELAYRATFLHNATTPMAEYVALLTGLDLARQLGATEVKAWGDAELIIRHVDGRYRCRDPRLQGLLALVRQRMKGFPACTVQELPKAGPKMKRRWGNQRADAIAGECMQLQRDMSSLPAQIRTSEEIHA